MTSSWIGSSLLFSLAHGTLQRNRGFLPFVVGFWSFTFPFAAATAYAIRWVHLEHPAGSTLLSLALLATITMLIGSIALRSLIAPARGRPQSGIATS